MILQSLTAYYDRLLDEGNIQPPGLQEKEIHWAVEIDKDGTFVALIRTGEGKRGRKAVVPAEVKRSGQNFLPNLLWDTPEYVLGVGRKGTKPSDAKKVEKRHLAFLERLRTLPITIKADAGTKAILAFYDRDQLVNLRKAESFAELVEIGGYVSFRLTGEPNLVCEKEPLQVVLGKLAMGSYEFPDAETQCLAKGNPARVARIHPSIKGVWGGKQSGGNIISFDDPAYRSHGWEQGKNAPVGIKATFTYVAALNFLLSRDNETHHRREGDTTFVFWAARKSIMEDRLASLFDGETVDEVEKNGQAVADVFDSIRKGLLVFDSDDTPFYVLGLAPNAARLAVRFWYEGTVADVAGRFRRHFDDLEIVDPYGKINNLGLWRLLGAASRYDKKKKKFTGLQPNLHGVLAAEVIAAVLKGTPYPHTLFARIVERCRAEQSVLPIRAALIKAILNRRIRKLSPMKKEITVSLDTDYDNPGYLLGRLFAVLEGIQIAATKANDPKAKINTTIRDRYFGAAVASPLGVFSQLMKLKNAHLKKIGRKKKGLAVMFDKQIDEILVALTAEDGIPSRLSLDDQGRFILGYHHQRSHRKKNNNGEADTNESPQTD